MASNNLSSSLSPQSPNQPSGLLGSREQRQLAKQLEIREAMEIATGIATRTGRRVAKQLMDEHTADGIEVIKDAAAIKAEPQINDETERMIKDFVDKTTSRSLEAQHRITMSGIRAIDDLVKEPFTDPRKRW